MNVAITPADIEGSGHGNNDDPLARALDRVTGKKWWTEVYSGGRRLGEGQAWVRGDQSHEYFNIDRETTRALQDIDSDIPFTPRTAVLTKG